ncbi:hypothetical protein JCM17823_25440 [Halorubrum gandharaense]
MPSRRTVLAAGTALVSTAITGCTDAVESTVGDDHDSEADGSDASDGAVPDDASFHVDLVVEETREFFGASEVRRAGTVSEDQQGLVYVPIELTERGSELATEVAVAVDLQQRHERAEFAVVVEDETVNRLGINEPFAASIVDGSWDGRFRFTFEDRSEAERVRRALVGDAE